MSPSCFTLIARTFWLAGLLLAACGEPSKDPSDESLTDPSTPAPGATAEAAGLAAQEPILQALANSAPDLELSAPLEYLRFELRLQAERAELVDLSRVALTLRPTPFFGDPEYLLIAYEDDRVVSAVPVSFPRTVSVSALSASGSIVRSEHDATTPTATVLLEREASINRMALTRRDGSVALEVSAAQLQALVAPQTTKALPAPTGRVGLSAQHLTDQDLQARYPSIRFLTANQEPMLSPDLLLGGRLVAATPALNDVIATALAQTPPAVLGSVRRIAFVSWPGGQDHVTDSAETDRYAGLAFGADFVLNADMLDYPDLSHVVLHELAHTYTGLLASAADAYADHGAWPGPAVSAAQTLVRRYSLTPSLLQVWSQLQTTGVAEGVGGYYDQEGWEALPRSQALRQGFASSYGSATAWEDIAEYVATTQLPTTANPGVCELFGKGPVTPDNALPYAKLALLTGLRAVTANAFARCVSSSKLPSTPGIQFPGSKAIFTGNPKGGVIVANGQAAFKVLAGSQSGASLLLEALLPDPRSSPLGLHRLGDIIANKAQSGAFLDTPSDFFLARVSQQGLLLVVESSAQRAQGVIFGLVMQNAVGSVTDIWPFGTFTVEH